LELINIKGHSLREIEQAREEDGILSVDWTGDEVSAVTHGTARS